MVITEALRLYPPAWTMGREALAGCEIGGHRVPAGTILTMSQWVLHRDPRYFEDPEAFKPERWARGADGRSLAERLPKYAYFPFGGGPRLCIGNSFAMVEAVLLLATIAQQFRLTLVPGHPVVPWPVVTLRPRYGMKMALRGR
jgi:cytochrome P450